MWPSIDSYSVGLFDQANEIVKANKLSDTITVLHGRVEVCFSSKQALPPSKRLVDVSVTIRVGDPLDYILMFLARWHMISAFPEINSLNFKVDSSFCNIPGTSNLFCIYCVYIFVVSTNHLFMSLSYSAY